MWTICTKWVACRLCSSWENGQYAWYGLIIANFVFLSNLDAFSPPLASVEGWQASPPLPSVEGWYASPPLPSAKGRGSEQPWPRVIVFTMATCLLAPFWPCLTRSEPIRVTVLKIQIVHVLTFDQSEARYYNGKPQAWCIATSVIRTMVENSIFHQGNGDE